MKKVFSLLFFILTFQLFSGSDKLIIMEWNVQNLFDDKDDPAKKDLILTTVEYVKKLEGVATIIRDIDPHIVCLCEVENIEVLKSLANKAGFNFYYLKEGNDPRGIDVAILSHIEMKYISHKKQPTPYPGDLNYRFSRDCIEANFQWNNQSFVLLLTHLRSHLGDPKKSLEKRNAQVKGILDIINSLYKQTVPNLILCGDFNSPRFSEPMRILEKSGLKILNYQYPQEKLFSTIYKNEKVDLDYFLFNQEILKLIRIKRYYVYQQNQVSQFSDHYPLILEITMN
ncbi:MAG: endonuclease/exonuclease/phosphatase family protein [Spirochaetes bacterium]|nr:endonuclease/exonuclease/phosphatase family protein [Spirochaetota bacterium]